MTDADEKQAAWERQPGEPLLWWSRLERYRLAGRGRSIRAIYLAELEAEGRPAGRTVPSAWTAAAQQWRWAERAEAFDEAELLRQREVMEQEYRAQLEKHRDAVLRVAQAEIAVGSKLLRAVQEILDAKKIKPDARSLAMWARAGQALADAGITAEAHVLRVDQALRQLDLPLDGEGEDEP